MTNCSALINDGQDLSSKVTPLGLPKPYYLLQVRNDPKFKLTAKSARRRGVNAEFTPAGWVYQRKEDAEDVAKRWTEGKRKLEVIRWIDPDTNRLLEKLWEGSKDEAKLAKEDLNIELSKFLNNKKIQSIEMECLKKGLHPSWLYFESKPDCLSKRELELYSEFKPKWDEATIEEPLEISLRESDLLRKKEDLEERIDNEVGKEIFISGIPKKVTDMNSLDQRFAQLEAPGRPCVYINRLDAQPISFSDFTRRLSGEVVRVDSDGQSKYIPASKFWEGNARKRIYKNIVFTNSKVDNETYNLFTGFGIKPKKGKFERIIDHIKDVICCGSEANKEAFIKLLAWQIQNIGKPSRIIVLLKSEQHQAGKGTLLQDILARIYGDAGYVTNNLDQIVGRFNDAIRGKAFIYLDEALFSGDRKSADAIKSLSTAMTIGVETKGVPSVQMPIGVNIFLSTNHKDAAHIEEGDARYWILEVSPHRIGDIEYFKNLYEEIDNGGREAFMDYILNLDVTNFVPMRDIPKDNAAKEEMIRNSINPYDARKWLEECCETSMILGHRQQESGIPYEKSSLPWEPWKTGCEYDNGIFYVAYSEWQKSVKSSIAPKPTASNNFGKLLSEAGFDLRIDGRRLRRLPSPLDCKKRIDEMFQKKMITQRINGSTDSTDSFDHLAQN